MCFISMASKVTEKRQLLVPDEALAPWHCSAVPKVANHWQVDIHQGLSVAEAAKRLLHTGPNELREKSGQSLWGMLAHQFSDFMIIVLLLAAVISGVVGDIKDGIAILVIVLLNAVIGFVQEFRAERAMAALARMGAQTALVLRAGERVRIAALEIVPGDIVSLEAGGVVPADLRLFETARLKINESLLTGESVPVEKQHALLRDRDLVVADRWNMAFKGTPVSYGRGNGIVVATGMATEIGKIAALLESGDAPQTPLQKRFAMLGKRLALASLGICAIIFAVGLMQGQPLLLMFLTAVSLAVAAIPEALPAVVTISLALGARKMVGLNALARRLPAVETLGSVTFICTDKTGTLTQNRMHVDEIYVAGRHGRAAWKARTPGDQAVPALWRPLFHAMALNNDAAMSSHGGVTGDPTEVALLHAAREAGFDKRALEKEMPRLLEFPFDSDRKRMTTFHPKGPNFIAYTKGAPETIIRRCHKMLTAAGEVAFDAAAILAAADEMAADGLRVLAVAYRQWPKIPEGEAPDRAERDMILLGLAGLIDPPRPEAREAVRQCRMAGIVPVMITGDHPATARAIARRLEILPGEGSSAAEDGLLVTGAELAKMSDEDFFARVAHVRVYARVNPAQKIRIVEALQKHGEFVAMTGDGVNDAPALQRADIGVAMGKDGTDVAREAASLVLLDDNFATIVGAVREGRRIYDNIRKFVRFVMTGNVGEVATIFLAPMLGLPIPLLPIHILWINLVTDGLPGLALAVEPAEKGIMQRPPRAPKESFFSRGLGYHIVWGGLLIAGLCLLAQAYAIRSGSTHWQTMVFTVLSLSQMGLVMALRSERESLFSQGFFTNLPLLGTVLFTSLLQLAIIYVPVLNAIFNTAPLTAGELAISLGLAGVVFVATECVKWLERSGLIYKDKSEVPQI
jgi:Ca2+-transporting ATPase